MEITRVDSKCEIRQANNSKTVVGEVHEFKERERLVVVLNKSVKLNMTWNGRMYEARMAGLDFTSDGPKVTKNKTGR
jgi:hypothetical protein